MAVLRETSAVAVLGLMLAASAASSQTPYEPPTPHPSTNDTASTPYQSKGDAAPAVPDWRAEQERRNTERADYLARKPVAYRWFADFPFGVSSGVPYIIL
jgi:hypothetical protein